MISNKQFSSIRVNAENPPWEIKTDSPPTLLFILRRILVIGMSISDRDNNPTFPQPND